MTEPTQCSVCGKWFKNLQAQQQHFNAKHVTKAEAEKQKSVPDQSCAEDYLDYLESQW